MQNVIAKNISKSKNETVDKMLRTRTFWPDIFSKEDVLAISTNFYNV